MQWQVLIITSSFNNNVICQSSNFKQLGIYEVLEIWQNLFTVEYIFRNVTHKDLLKKFTWTSFSNSSIWKHTKIPSPAHSHTT